METVSTQLNLIVACAANRVIGKEGAMPWHIPQELAHFKRLTLGCPVIMGRKTWDSIVASLGKPLPGRTSIVVTHNLQWTAPGAIVVNSVLEAIAACKQTPLAWVIGGASIYKQALPYVQQCHVTEIHQAFDGDAWFDALPSEQWNIVSKTNHAPEPPSGLGFDVVVYQRLPATPVS